MPIVVPGNEFVREPDVVLSSLNLRRVEGVRTGETVEELTLGPGVGDHNRAVALHKIGPAEHESSRTHPAGSGIRLHWFA
jgi:hypothetical protein